MSAEPNIAPLIRLIRGARVILDADLAQLYGVETRALNQALKRNQERFPDDFAFELTRDEILGMSQTVISLRNLKFSKQVRAFTEHGALMAANLLNSPHRAPRSEHDPQMRTPTAAPQGREKIALGKASRAAALGQRAHITPSPEGATETESLLEARSAEETICH